MNLYDYVKNVPDFPEKGIQFKDITPLIGDGEAFRYATRKFAEFAQSVKADVIVGPDARGFIFGAPVATHLGIGFVPVRKPGKLPRPTLTETYSLEYGTNALSVHEGDLRPGQNVLIVDDLLATGGTIKATMNLIERSGATVAGLAFLIELKFLEGRTRLPEAPIFTLLQY
ncbi:MAG: adenine phosphoribosyltransferase [Acholeplasmatales bacterium]|nr:MAG: adenine phosphoribosyltransferase [Acholeplasmatales bacterium]